MLFDKVVSLCEHHKELKFLQPMLRACKLFILPYEVKKFNIEEHLDENFFLPFPAVAISTGDRLFFWVNMDEETVGLNRTRGFIDIAPLQDGEMDGVSSGISLCLSQLRFKDMNVGNRTASADIDGIFMARGNKRRISVKSISDAELKKYPEGSRIIDGMLNDAMVSMYQVSLINHPDNFILETTTPKNMKKTGKKIPRAHQRPQYTLLKPHAIREIMRLPQQEGTGRRKRGGGDVRAHMHFLKHPKFRFDPKTGMELEPKPIPHGPHKGKPHYRTKFIPAHWRGPSEAIVGNKVYRVVLDDYKHI